MAKTAEEKKAYAREYYQKYKKKGLKKGRKKGSKKSTKQTNLVGLSNSGLNDQGKMQWALAKEKLKTDMNAALAKATTPEEKAKIRQEYQNKALGELNKIKGDPAMAKAKATKTSSAKSSSKSSSKSTGSSKSSAGSSKGSSKSSSSGSSNAQAVQQATAQMQQAVKQMQDYVTKLTERLLGGTTADGETLESKLSTLTDEQKEKVRKSLEDTIAAIRKQLNKG